MWYDATFFLGAAVAQVALGGYLLTGPRREWRLVIALLFLLNGIDAGLSALREMSIGVALMEPYFGLVSNVAVAILLVYLALTYPRRLAVLARRPWVLPVAAAGLFAVYVVLLLVGGRGLVEPGRSPSASVQLPGAIFGYALPAIAWGLLLARWAHTLPTEADTKATQQFGLVFAAFGVRAANLTVHIPLLFLMRMDSVPHPLYMAFAWPFQILALVALAGALVYLAFLSTRQAGPRRQVYLLVLAFLIVGVVEAFLILPMALDFKWSSSPLIQFDLYVLRPGLLWFAMARHDLAGRPMRYGWAGLWVLVALAVVAGFVGLQESPPPCS
jgi:hypothetical protein